MAAFSKPNGGVMGLVLTVLLVIQTVTASHSHMRMHLIHRSPEAALQARADVISKGADDGTAYPRLEIRELQKNEDQFNLYLLALESFMAKPKTDPQSYYQISGIHGRPFIPWNEPGPLKNVAGYCPHGAVLFGTWHRPFLALYEQALYANAKEVVASFPSGQRQKWEDALKGLRMPYFDWAMEPTTSGENIPKVIRDANISVTKPSGKVTIKNPLYSYSFGSSLPSEMGWGPANGFPETLRSPSGTTSNNDAVNSAFGQARVGWRQRIFALFATRGDWGRVSSSQYGLATSRQNTDSYEAVHDEIHSTIGGTNGHMSYLDVAAFDPLFWLHHTNIDRFLTMHQIIAPQNFVASGVQSSNTAQWNAGEMKDGNTPLKPFMKDASGSYYTSSDVRETRTLGYFYKETESKDVNSVISAINKLYGLGERGLALDPVSSSSSAAASSSSASRGASSSSRVATSSSAPSSSDKVSSSAASGAAGGSSSRGGAASSSAASSSGKASSSSAPGASGSSSRGGASATGASSQGSGASATKSSGGDSSKPTGKPGSGNGDVNVNGKPFPGRPFKDGDYDTVLSVVGDKWGLPGSCKIFCFLGNKPVTANNSTSNHTLPGTSTPGNSTKPATPAPVANSTGTDYYNHPDYVGSHTFLGGSVAKTTNASSPVLVEGSIPLTACLQGKIQSGELKSLHPDDVEPYLAKNLHYKVIGPNGNEIQPEKLPNFHAKVKSCPVTPAPEGQLPTYHEYIDLPRVNIPASNPWTPPPQPPTLPSSGSPGKPGSSSPIGSMPMPWDEPGYCVSKQTIKYVDSNGKFLYEETY